MNFRKIFRRTAAALMVVTSFLTAGIVEAAEHNDAAQNFQATKDLNDADRDSLAKEKLDEGVKRHDAQDYNGAIKLYTETIELKPDLSFGQIKTQADFDKAEGF